MIRTTRAGVLGWPVRHSRSPAMHNAGYSAAGLDGWRYQLLPVPPEVYEFARAGRTLHAIKAYCQATGADLAAGKRFVEGLPRS